MNINEYFSLLERFEFQAANELRIKDVPKKLIKFVALSDDKAENEKKFLSLENNQIWFSKIEELNDPYEYKCMYIDIKKLVEGNCPKELIDGFISFLDKSSNDIALASFSTVDNITSIPMWAYYTNSHKGFCVEYEVVDPEPFFQVSYEPKRIPIASIIANFYNEFSKMIESGKEFSNDVIFYAELLRLQYFLKHKSWKHEKEYRAIFPIEESAGKNIDINGIGLKAKRVVAGIKCEAENVNRLNIISEKLCFETMCQMKTSENEFTLIEEVHNA